jgi:integrase
MARANGSQQIRANGQTSLADYFEKRYLPWVEANKAASTARGYKQVWTRYVQPHLGKIAPANLRTVQVTALLDHYANNGLNQNSLSRVKFLLSGIYHYAIKTGALPTGKNPVTGNIKGGGAGWTASVARPKQQTEYSRDTVLTMLRILEQLDIRAAVAVGLAYLAALRTAEMRGLQWGDTTAPDWTSSGRCGPARSARTRRKVRH